MKKGSVFIIAEAGVNHNGSLRLAKKLVDAAKKAGADAVKFQTYRTEDLVTRRAPKAAYQNKTVPGKSQYDMLKSLELSVQEFKALSSYCRKKKILFLSTPFDIRSADLLRSLGMKMFKVSSGDLTNIPMLKHIAKYKRPIILSTGMATINEVKEAVKAVYSAGNRKIVLLHCTSNYPARYEDVNLRAMDTMAKELGLPVGYSDHTQGLEISIAAAARGASVIEKHFTLSRKMKGPDHMSSIEPDELSKLVSAIKKVELSMGDGVKAPRNSEKAALRVGRKSLVASVDIPKGSRLTRQMIAVKRPGTGMSPSNIGKIIGRTAKKDIGKDKLIMEGDIKR
ncbi:MAG: N-acetylneuraminate synthase [Candidatus Margulisiibacteriota bacterium]